jgi:hypothetical protein
MVDARLGALHHWLHLVCAPPGLCTIEPEQMVRALLVQALFSIPRNRLLIEQIWYSRLYRWFVGLQEDVPRWNQAIFSAYREQMLAHELIRDILARVMLQAGREGLLTSEARMCADSCIARWADCSGNAPASRRQRSRESARAPVSRRACDCGLIIDSMIRSAERQRAEEQEALDPADVADEVPAATAVLGQAGQAIVLFDRLD